MIERNDETQTTRILPDNEWMLCSAEVRPIAGNEWLATYTDPMNDTKRRFSTETLAVAWAKAQVG